MSTDLDAAISHQQQIEQLLLMARNNLKCAEIAVHAHRERVLMLKRQLTAALRETETIYLKELNSTDKGAIS